MAKNISCLLLFLLGLELVAQVELPDSLEPVQNVPASRQQPKTTFGDKMRNLGISKSFKNTKSSFSITVALQQAKLAEQQGKYLTAINHYQKIIDLYVEQGDQQSVTDYLQEIALLYQKAGYTQQALDKYEEVLQRKEFSGDTTNLALIRQNLTNLGSSSLDSSNAVLPKPVAASPMTKAEAETESARLKSLAETSENSADYKRSLEYYKLYTELTNQQKESEQAQQLALQEKTFELEKQAQQMSLLESEREIQALTLARQQEQLQKEQSLKRNLLIGTSILFLAVLATFMLYRGKRKALGDLNLAYLELNSTKDKLVVAEGELKRLLGQQVSSGVAQQLMDHEKADKGQKIFVCVMFLDIREFTPFAEKLLPEELIQYQNDVFGLMIDIIDRHQGVINQFLGDGFMATFGLQEDKSNVCDNALQAAIDIITEVNQQSEAGIIPATRVGIGLHAGTVVAGNVGTAIRKQYSITGNTVITAARIEQLNKRFQSQILISKEVYQKLSNVENLPDEFHYVKVKGRNTPVELLKIA
jgi:class 3 adenylate cyclase